ncbi:MAG TPA: acetolactate decarboxylase [Vicinamibacteria bacterium]|nr:acetolactate decarboxylase [Vicinamibacteria bacterium]
MSNFRMVAYLLLASMLLVDGAASPEPGGRSDVLYQVSTLGELLVGNYDGRLSFRSLSGHGNFGLGTFDRLDGEMVAFDGQFFQVTADGVATRVARSATTPFAAVTFFQPDDVFELEGPIPCSELRSTIASRFPSEELLYAIRVDGTFTRLQTRSVPAQEKPYVPLEEALRGQIVFDFAFADATLAGFWFPSDFANVNVTGFHFHALTKDRTTGGHVLDCEALDVTVAIDHTGELQVRLGTPEARGSSREGLHP